MAGAARRITPALSIEAFRAFVEGRPNEEHWELIDGVPMMMAPATLDHQRIASNLERLLNDALEAHDPSRAAYQRTGLNLGPDVPTYDPEPDVTVIDAVHAPGQRYVDRFYLAAEIVSDSDSKTVAGKREVYKLHAHCTYVLTVQQDRCDVQVDRHTEAGWQTTRLTTSADVLELPEFGLRCALGALYKGTSLRPTN
jgi:Uma2 family endonuclease